MSLIAAIVDVTTRGVSLLMETKRILFQKNSETPCVVKATVAAFDVSPQGIKHITTGF
jgi:hypothetical protein